MSSTLGFVGVGIGIRANRANGVGETCMRGGGRQEARWVMAAKKKSSSAKPKKLSVKGFGGMGKKKSPDDLELSRDKKMEALYSWLKKGGASFGRVAVGEKSGRRGVFALEPIQKGDVICSIPKGLALTLGQNDTDPTAPANLLLRMKLGKEEGSEFFEPMISALPSREDCTSAIFFSKEQVESLEYPEMSTEVSRRIAQIDRNFKKFSETAVYSGDMENPFSPGGLGYDEDDLKWAVFIIVSRALGIEAEPQEFVKILIPFIDMVNHDSNATNQLKFKEGEYRIVAGSQIDTGEEVFIQYGDGELGNFQLLADYGFVEEGNKNDARRLIKGNVENIKPEFKPEVLKVVRGRMDELKIPAEEDEKILAAAPGGIEEIIARFRRQHRAALQSIIDEVS